MNYSLLVYRMNACIRKEEGRGKKHLSSVISPECDISVSSKSSFEDVQPESLACVLLHGLIYADVIFT